MPQQPIKPQGKITIVSPGGGVDPFTRERQEARLTRTRQLIRQDEEPETLSETDQLRSAKLRLVKKVLSGQQLTQSDSTALQILGVTGFQRPKKEKAPALAQVAPDTGTVVAPEPPRTREDYVKLLMQANKAAQDTTLNRVLGREIQAETQAEINRRRLERIDKIGKDKIKAYYNQVITGLQKQGHPKAQIRQTIAADMLRRYGIRPEDLGYPPLKEVPPYSLLPIPPGIKSPALKP